MSNKFSIKSPMPPIWLMYPNFQNDSIGLRMGYGENYLDKFNDWFETLSKDEQIEYDLLFPKPIQWSAFNKKQIIKRDEYWTYKWSDNRKYSLKQVQEDFNAGKKLEFIFFLEHASPLDGSIAQNCFCQWYRSNFSFSTFKYSSMEQYMMSEKAKLFNDKNIYKEIMKEKKPKVIKMLGRMVDNFDDNIWDTFKYEIVLNGNYHKFMQNKELKKYLLSTKGKIIVEASPSDRIWGIGMDKHNENIENPMKWRGENLLGFAIMEARDEIERVCKNEILINYKEVEKYLDEDEN